MALVKVVVQIPCLNEAENLPTVIQSIPRHIDGVDRVDVLVVDDGSTDGTSEVARRAGADHVVRHAGNRGLAAAFRTALDTSLRLGADIIVTTDGDNQYPQADIPRLVRPILDGEADVVLGDRQPGQAAHFSRRKRLLQRLGSRVVRIASGTSVQDAPSGFRAISRETALRLTVLSGYSYAMETLIQLGAERLRVVSIPIEARPTPRPSRLMRNLPHYLLHSGATILRAYAMYRPLVVFTVIGLTLIGLGSLGFLRFLYYLLTEGGPGHVQSLVVSGMVVSVGFFVLMSGLLADLISANRRIEQEILQRVRRLEARSEYPPEAPDRERVSTRTDDVCNATDDPCPPDRERPSSLR